MRILLKLLLWLIVILGFFFIVKEVWPFESETAADESITQTTILEKIEALGKLELVKYNFQEITELTQKNSRYLGIFPTGDSKAVLISHGEAVGCIDLTKIAPEDIQLAEDTLFVNIPEPEICYYKLDLARTRIYSIEKGVYYKDEKKLIEKAYKSAEKEIREAALNSGILKNTDANAEALLKPLLESLSGKKVVFKRTMVRREIENFH